MSLGTILAANIGNTDTVVGLVTDGTVVSQWRLATLEARTSDEWGVLLRGLLAGAAVDGVALCATVPSVLAAWRGTLTTYFGGVPHVIVEPGVRTGIPVRVDNPRELGADRIVNAIAAAHLYGGPAIVVDFGTATVFDVVNDKGEYIGGAIAAGLRISLEALERRGAQLRKVELARPRSAIAKNTVEALQSGLVFGFAAQVDGIVERMTSELTGGPPRVVATGGLAPVVLDECTTVTDHNPCLTLKGLELVYRRNA